MKTKGNGMGRITLKEDKIKLIDEAAEKRRQWMLLHAKPLDAPEDRAPGWGDYSGADAMIKTGIPPKFKPEAIEKWRAERDQIAIEKLFDVK